MNTTNRIYSIVLGVTLPFNTWVMHDHSIHVENRLIKILNIKLMVCALIIQMTFMHNAMGGLIGPTGWNGDNIEGFLKNGAFPGSEVTVSMLDFNGKWMYTAIGRESGHTNDIDEASNPGKKSSDSLLTFSTANASNWGVWDTVDFDIANLFFEDSDGPWNVGLDYFGIANDSAFKLFHLTQNTTLTHLSGNSSLSLFVNDIIVGFNDNNKSHSGGDYDDIIVAMRAPSVPEPTILVLFAIGIMGLASRRFMKQS